MEDIHSEHRNVNSADLSYGTKLLAAAKAYSAKGWVAIPVDLSRGKLPAERWGHLTADDAATNVPRITQAMTRLGAANTGLAILTAPSGLVVIDVDAKDIAGCPHNGAVDDDGTPARHSARLAALLTMAGAVDIDNALWASTQSGGWHLVFARPDDATIQSSVARHVKGIDYRAGWRSDDGSYRSGGYFVCSPTRTAKGEYWWGADLDAVSELPPELNDLLHTKPDKSGKLVPVNPGECENGTGQYPGTMTDDILAARQAYAGKAMREELDRLRTCPSGTRNDALNQIAFRFGQLDEALMLTKATSDTIFDQLVKAGVAVGQRESEASGTVASGWNAGHEKADAKLAEIGKPKGSVVAAMAMPRVNGSAVLDVASATAATAAQPSTDLQSLEDRITAAINACHAGDSEALFDDVVLDAAARLKTADENGRWAAVRQRVKQAQKGRIGDWESEVAFVAAGINRAAKADRAATAWPVVSPATGKPIPAIENVQHAMRLLGVEVFEDQFAMVARIRTDAANKFACFSEVNDAAMRALRIGCEGVGLRLKATEFVDYLLEVARVNGEHPVRDYLDSISWDGIERADDWLTEYCDVGDDLYSRAVGKLFLVGAVRRVRRPGVKLDTMVVFEGRQGAGKSSMLRLLAGNDWFTDAANLGDDAKLMLEQTAGKWIVEVAELTGMRRADVEKVKGQIARQTDRARLAYGRGTTERPRQFVMAGTTNGGTADGYLVDRTGNRRFLPITIGKIDLKGLAKVRDQLWAEAAWLEAQGEPHTLPEKLWSWAADAQAARVETLPLEEILTAKIDGLKGFIPATALYAIVGLDGVNILRASGMQGRLIKAAMERAGWKTDRRTAPTGQASGQASRVRGYSNAQGGDWYVAHDGRLVRQVSGP